ncbi:MAG: hypothetical protein IKU43_10955 [Clostridia bacterium]|nr:hypothetical protein [Clostridia bacterium]
MPENQSNSVNVCKIRKSIDVNGKRAIEINLEYPQIKTTEKAESTFNDFYSSLVRNYMSFCEKKLIKTAEARMRSDDSFRPFGEIMKCIVSYEDNFCISVILDITHYDGYFRKMRRISQVWSKKDGIILPSKYLIKKYNLTPRKIRKRIGDMISENLKNEGHTFSFTEKGVRRYAYGIKPDNMFLCKKGLAFWFEAGTVAPESEGFPTFIIPTEQS